MKEASYNLIDDVEYTPPNFRSSKIDGGFLVWVVDKMTGDALSVAFVPEAVDYSLFSSAEPAELPEGDPQAFNGPAHVHVHNPTTPSYPGSRRIPLEVWVVNK